MPFQNDQLCYQAKSYYEGQKLCFEINSFVSNLIVKFPSEYRCFRIDDNFFQINLGFQLNDHVSK